MLAMVTADRPAPGHDSGPAPASWRKPETRTVVYVGSTFYSQIYQQNIIFLTFSEKSFHENT